MNQQCKVCGEPAAGFHFGAFTCEGCKSFFGRTYNNLSSISDCKNGGVCVINKKNRTACKACRLRKCLRVGMSKSGSRYGRRSNWFKIHCLLQEQTNGNQATNPGGFGASFLPGFLPPSTPSVFKDKDRASPSQEDLALQSHLLQVAILKQERERGNKSPHPDDIALQNQLRLLAWHKERDRIAAGQHHHPQEQQQQQQQQAQQQNEHHQQQSGTPPREGTPPSFNYKYPSTSPMFPVNFAQEKMLVLPSSPPDVFRPYLPLYNRAADTPSDSGASSVDVHENDESRSNSALSCFKVRQSPTLSEREYPARKINATVPLSATGYHPHSTLSLLYPPPGLVTPATSQHSPRGGDLLLVSPSPGGLAVEQDEPIDLSVKPTKSSLLRSPVPNSTESKLESGDNDVIEEAISKSKPLDLTFGSSKRPAEIQL